MKINKVMTAAVTALIVISAFLFFANKSVKAEGDNNAVVLQKLDEVISGQKAILDGMESLKREINIVKIRVTQAQ